MNYNKFVVFKLFVQICIAMNMGHLGQSKKRFVTSRYSLYQICQIWNRKNCVNSSLIVTAGVVLCTNLGGQAWKRLVLFSCILSLTLIPHLTV